MTPARNPLLEHPCKDTCSGWKQGYEAGARSRQGEVDGLKAELDDARQTRLAIKLVRAEQARDALTEQVKALTAELETERMRLAGCGVAAMCNTEKTIAKRIARDSPYWSASYGDVCAAVDREMSLRDRVGKQSEIIASWMKSDAIKNRTPVGYRVIEAWRKGPTVVIVGEPENEEGHSCDQMGCGSLDHVLERVTLGELDALRERRGKLREALEHISASSPVCGVCKGPKSLAAHYESVADKALAADDAAEEEDA